MKCDQCKYELQDSWISRPNCGHWVGRPNIKVADVRANRRRTPTYVFLIVALALLSFVAMPVYFYVQYMRSIMGMITNLSDDTGNCGTVAGAQAPCANIELNTPTSSWTNVCEVDALAKDSPTKDTEAFTVGSKWRVTWQATTLNGKRGKFSLTTKTTNGTHRYVIASTIGAATGVTNGAAPGDYYLYIRSTEPFKVDVDNYK